VGATTTNTTPTTTTTTTITTTTTATTTTINTATADTTTVIVANNHLMINPLFMIRVNIYKPGFRKEYNADINNYNKRKESMLYN
jgi:hypothetical protein